MVKAGVDDSKAIKREMTAVITSICPSAEIDYIAFTEFTTLAQVRKIARNTICSLAVRVHGIRLIDNIRLY